jgi:hypothetical protein
MTTTDPSPPSAPEAGELLAKATTAVTDEWGSKLCYWPFGGGARVCTLQVGPECRCQQLASVVLEAVDLRALTRERDAAVAVVDAARAYREAEMDGTPRFFRGKHLHDLGRALSTALAALSPSESPRP